MTREELKQAAIDYLGEAFKVPVALKEFVAAWMTIPVALQTRLGNRPYPSWHTEFKQLAHFYHQFKAANRMTPAEFVALQTDCRPQTKNVAARQSAVIESRALICGNGN